MSWRGMLAAGVIDIAEDDKVGPVPAAHQHIAPDKGVEIILAIYESAWTGKKVSLPLKSDPRRPS